MSKLLNKPKALNSLVPICPWKLISTYSLLYISVLTSEYITHLIAPIPFLLWFPQLEYLAYLTYYISPD